MTEFTNITCDLPCRIVVACLEIGFKYSGQPATCYHCQSTEHAVKNCPKRRPNRPKLVGDLPAPPTLATENQESDNVESQMDVSASNEQNPSQSQWLLDTPSQATPSYTGMVQAEPTHSSPSQRPSKPAPPLKAAPPNPGKYAGKWSLNKTAADSNADLEEAKRQIVEITDHNEPLSAEQTMADVETEHTEGTEENTPQPSGMQAEKSPVTPPLGSSSNLS